MQAVAVADSWFNWRNRLLGSEGFRRLATRFPLTRWIARRRAAALFDLVAGFVYSQVLLACVRLHLFDILSEGPQTLDTLAHRLGLPPPAADRLLSAAVALRLVERRGAQRFGLGALGAPMVGNHAIAAMVEHHGALYADLADPIALLRGETGAAHLARYWPYATGQHPAGAPDVAAYTALMSASQPLVAEEILDAYPFQHHRCLLDIGGGEGTFLRKVAERVPGLALVLFDLPPVAERARVRFAQQGLAQRCQAVGGSFVDDPLPTGADIATLVRVVHDHDDAVVLALLVAARKALNPGGTLLLAEPMAQTPGAEAMGDAYFGFYLLAMGSGRPRSKEVLTQLLQQAGFEAIRPIATRMPLQTSILVARAPDLGKNPRF
ncbi:MAG: methyltransferase domain-containing protein [Rhodoferax sp.]|nr:methyltransferase domain-containing protein [Rhodoferax sp.]